MGLVIESLNKHDPEINEATFNERTTSKQNPQGHRNRGKP